MILLKNLSANLNGRVEAGHKQWVAVKAQLPELSPESLEQFQTICAAGADEKCLTAASQLEGGLSDTKRASEQLGIDCSVLAPFFKEGNNSMRQSLLVVCSSTAARIVSSKSAKKHLPDARGRARPGIFSNSCVRVWRGDLKGGKVLCHAAARVVSY